MKRFLAICIAALLVFTAFPFSVQAASENVTLTVTADKSTANPGDTVNFTVKLGKVNELGGGEFTLTIPGGLTITQSAVPSGLGTTLKADGDGVNWDKQSDSTYKWSYASDVDQAYSGTADLTILTFSCKVDDNPTFEAKSVTLTGAKLFDATLNNGDFTSHNVTVVPASVTVQKKPVAVTGVSLDKTTASIQEDGTLQLTATVAPATADNKNVSWSSSKTSVATVSATGLVTAVAEGTTNITVTTQDGNKTAVCAVTVTHKHSMSALTPAQDATCTEDGNVAYYTCTSCNKKYSDAAGTTELSNVVVPATGHSAGSTWQTDSDKHWKACTNTGCTVKLQEAAHSYQWKVDTAATEDSTGIKHEECACGLKRNENTVIPKLDHVHTMTSHPAVPATCSKEGKKQYWTCSSSKCTGKIYGDATGQLVVTEDSLVLAKDEDAHVYDNDGDGTCNQCDFVRFYVVIEGADGTYTEGSSEGLTFRVDGDFSKFKELKINGKVVDKAYYTAVSGSTIITLNSSYLGTLSPAKYTMEVVYTDGKVATTTLNIAANNVANPPAAVTPAPTENTNASEGDVSSAPESDTNTTETPAEEAPATTVSPKTGEQGTYALWISMVAGVAIATTGVLVYRKKKIS